MVFALAQIGASREPHLSVDLRSCDPGPLCISWVMPAGHGWAAGLRVGDQAIRSEGPRGELLSDPQVVYVPRGDGVERVAPQYSTSGTVRWSFPLLGLVYLALGSLVRSRRPDLTAARSFWLLGVAVGLAGAVAPDAGFVGSTWALVLQFAVLLLIPWALLRFFTDLVPLPLPILRGYTRSAAVVGSVIFVAYIAVVSVRPDLYPLVRASMALNFLILTSLAIVALILTYRAANTRPERAVVGVMAGSAALGVAPVLLLSIIPVSLGTSAIVGPDLSALATIAIPLAFVYAVFRHQLMGIRRLIRRGVVYLAVSAILLGTMTLALAMAWRLLPHSIDRESAGLWIGAVALITGGLAFSYLRPRAQRLVDRLIYRDSYDYIDAIRGLARQAQTPVMPRDVVARVLEQVMSLMGIEGYLLATYVGGSAEEATSGGPGADKLRKAMRQIELPTSETATSLYVDGEPVLALRVEGGSALWLGPKIGGESFRDDDFHLAEPVGTLVGMLLTRSQLTDELRNLNRRLLQAEEEERSRLAMDIHDGPLQRAIDLARRGFSEKGAMEAARSLVGELRGITTSLRPPLLDDLGLRYALDWLIQTVASPNGLSIGLEVDGYCEDTRLPAEIELAVYRVVQESLANVVKHAKAEHVTVSLSLSDDELIVQIRDDGIGFDEEASRSAAAKGHLGLVGIRERVHHAGGELQVVTRHPEGTNVRMAVPVTGESSARLEFSGDS